MSLFQIKKQIDTIRKTKQITNAMKLVSTAKYNKIVEESKHYYEYSRMVRKLVYHVIRPNIPTFSQADLSGYIGQAPIDYHHMLVERPIKKTGYLIITSDKGFAGDYNSTLIKKVDEFFKQNHPNKDDLVVLGIGDPIIKYCKDNQIELVMENHNLSDYPKYTEVQKIIQKSIELYNEKFYDSLVVMYNYSANIMLSRFKSKVILPLKNIHFDEDEFDKIDYIIEPTPEDVLDELLTKFVESQIYGAIIDAKTSEQASRMQAMSQATNNADDLIFKLQKKYNHERQYKITNEILDIINGTQAQQE